MKSQRLIYLIPIVLIITKCSPPVETTKDDPWDQAAVIVETVGEITFPDNTYNVIDFGVQNDTTVLSTQGFNQAIKTCSKEGGGKVIVPAGNYLTGPIHLESNVNFHLEEGAEIFFSTDTKDFPLVHTSFEGTELMNFSPLIYAFGKKNLGITGKGTLNGQADNDHWWPWKGSESYGWSNGEPHQNDSLSRPRLIELAASNVPVEERIFGEGYFLRPTFVEPLECEGILIEGITIVNAPFWVIHPLKSNKIMIDNVKVVSHGPNNDGCDPEYCKNVIIRNCHFNTGDDCIAIKSGRNEDGRRVNITSENILVQDCKMIDGHGGVVMGSEISAGVRNVFVENCSMDSPNLDRAIRIKTNTRRGGFVENVYVRNLEVGQVKEAVLKVNLYYGTYENQVGDYMPRVKNIQFENVNVKNGGKFAILADGYEESPIDSISFKNVKIDQVESMFSLKHVTNLTFSETYLNGKLIEQ